MNSRSIQVLAGKGLSVSYNIFDNLSKQIALISRALDISIIIIRNLGIEPVRYDCQPDSKYSQNNREEREHDYY